MALLYKVELMAYWEQYDLEIIGCCSDNTKSYGIDEIQTVRDVVSILK